MDLLGRALVDQIVEGRPHLLPNSVVTVPLSCWNAVQLLRWGYIKLAMHVSFAKIAISKYGRI